MSGNSGRHRNVGADASRFWAAKDLCDPAVSTAAKHARRATSRYAVSVGRVGALAVSLGIGFAIANSATGYASAETDSDPGSSSESPASKSAPSDSDGAESGQDDAGQANDAGDDAEESDSGDLEGSDDEDDVDDEDEADLQSEDDDADELVDDDDESGDEVKIESAPPAPATKRTSVKPSDTVELDVPVASEEDAESAKVLSAVVANVVAPLADPDLPAPSPLADGVLAYIRRLITHTFFNKTPVVRGIETEQILTGQTIITIDAYDPNGDPLTYEIVQPETGLVFREPLTGAFVYTPTLPVIGDNVPVKFDVIIHDDSEHLPGILGTIQNLLHSVARIFGLAQRDNLTQTIEFESKPILQGPPVLVVVGGLPYIVGADPVDLLLVANITDVDSPNMKEATVTVGLNRQDGDLLSYVAPDGVTIAVEQVNDYTLKFTGEASQADYEAALKAVAFSTTTAGLVGRTVDITVTDEHGLKNLAPAFVLTVVLPTIPLDAPPSVVAVGGLPYFLGGQPVNLLSVAEILDLDSASLKKATIKIGDLGRVTGDALQYTAPSGVTLAVNQVNNYTIELSGIASKADYEKALKAITFSASQLGLAVRTVEITLTDADDINSLAPALVAATVLPAIGVELPLIVTPVGLPVHTVGKAPVKLLSSVVIANADNGELTGAVVTIEPLNRLAGDKLGFVAVPGNPVTVTQTNDWTLTLSGTATVEQYQAALKAVTFSTTQVGLPRTVTINVTEGDGNTSPAPGIVFANSIVPLPPTIVAAPIPPTYTIGRPGSVLTPLVTIEDVDSTVLTGAVVTIGVGRQAGDTLSYTPQAGNPITASWNGTNTLTLSGTATVEQYEAALQAVRFSATGGAGVLRTMSINVTDDSGLSALLPGVATALVKNPDRPTVVTAGLSALDFPTVGETVKPITLATIVDPDSAVLSGASVKITDKFTTGDALAYTPISGNPITAAYNTSTGELKLTGPGTVAQYKQALEAITFTATRYGGGLLDALGVTRTMTVNVTDDTNLSSVLPGVVLVTVFRPLLGL